MLALPIHDARGASTRYRVLAHLPAFEAAGWAVRVRYPLRGPRSGPLRLAWRVADIGRDLWGPRDADLLFVQRKMFPAAFAGRLKRAPGKVVFDLDDAIDLPPPSRRIGEAARRRYRSNFEATLTACDLVLCGNRELASRLPHDRYELLPTPIDTRRFASGLPAAEPVLGWVGHSDNLRYLEALADPLRELARRHPGLRLIAVADRPPRIDGIDVEFRRWSLEQEVACFRGMRVGLMPLADDAWSRSKCAFKAIQYMALGLPAVASPVGMNREVIDDGVNGFLPSDSSGWVDTLDRLLADDGLACRIGEAGRRTVEARYALDVVSRRLVSILDGVCGPGPRRVTGASRT